MASQDFKRSRKSFSLRELSVAVNRGHAGVIHDYLSQGGDPNAADQYGYSLLHEAAYCKRLPIVRMLVEAGADVNAKNNHQSRPLTEALRVPLVKMLLRTSYSQMGRRPHDPETHFQIVKCLLDAGAEANVYRDEEGLITRGALWGFRTPLMLAAEAGNVALVQLLLQHGADTDARDYSDSTALLRAVGEGHLPIVELLVEAGADVNAQQEGGRTPLMRAIYAANIAEVEYESYARERRKKIKPEAIQAIRTHYARIAEYLIGAGADVNVVDARGQMALFACVNECRNDLLEMVIEAGADLQHRDNEGNTALHFLMKVPKSRGLLETEVVELAQALLDAGVERDAIDGGGKTALELATANRNTQLMRLLSR